MSRAYTALEPEAETLIQSLPNFVTAAINERHLLRPDEPHLYLIIRSNSSPDLRFFTLLGPQNGQRRRFVPIQPIPSSYTGSAYAALGPELYVLAGSHNDVASPRVSVLDCQSNTWRPGPSMQAAREFAVAGVVNSKIYVMGGCVAGTWTRAANWAEALDPRTCSWVAVPSPDKGRDKWMRASIVVDGRIYAMAYRGGVVYDPRRELWSPVESELVTGWKGRVGCVVVGILYCYESLGKIRGFDLGEWTWKELKGVENDLPRFICGAAMTSMGGNLVVVWEGEEKNGRNGREMTVWCAEIEVRKDWDGELVGRICWLEPVLTVPAGSSIVDCGAVVL